MAPKEVAKAEAKPKLENRQGKKLGSGTTSQARKDRRAYLQMGQPQKDPEPAPYTPSDWQGWQSWYGWSSASSSSWDATDAALGYLQQPGSSSQGPQAAEPSLKKDVSLEKDAKSKIQPPWSTSRAVLKPKVGAKQEDTAVAPALKKAEEVQAAEVKPEEVQAAEVPALEKAEDEAATEEAVQTLDTALEKAEPHEAAEKVDDSPLQKGEAEAEGGHPKDRSSQSEVLADVGPIIEGDRAIFGRAALGVKKVDLSSSSSSSSSSSDDEVNNSTAKKKAKAKAMPKEKEPHKRESSGESVDYPALKKASSSASSSNPPWKRSQPVLTSAWNRQFPTPDPYHIGMDWHKCLEKGGWVPPHHVDMLHQLWGKGFKISLCSFMGKGWTTAWYKEVLALPYVSSFRGIHDTQQRSGTSGKCFMYKTLGIKIAVDDNAEVTQECFERGMAVYPVCTYHEKHYWYQECGFQPYASFIDACVAIMRNHRVLR